MNDYRELCETLRLANSWQFAPKFVNAMLDAADAIEKLVRERDKLKLDLCDANAVIEFANDKLKKVEKERDTAVKWVPRQCGTCKHFKSDERTKMCFKGSCADWKRMENWEWRGVQKVAHEET